MNDSISTLPLEDDDAIRMRTNRFSSSDDFKINHDCIGMEQTEDTSKRKSKRYGIVDRRQQKQNNHSRAEQRALLADREDSDLERNIGRLCQYLSGSEDGDDEDNREDNNINLQRPTGLFVLNSHYHKRKVASETSSSIVSDENYNCTTQQMPISQSDNSSQVIPMQRLVPRDFLNIPPPAQPPPPDDSPSIDRPLPPQRTLPPLPDEPLYEEAKPAPPSPMPRPSKQQLPLQSHKNNHVSPGMLNSNGKVSAIVSPVMASSYHASSQRDEEGSEKPLYLSQGSQYNDIGWHNYETSILERNEAGRYFIPSGQTTLSSISPSRKSDMEQQRLNNYLLSPSAQTTVPAPILPVRQELSNVNHRSRHYPFHRKAKLPAVFTGKDGTPTCCTWKCMTYSLAATLVFVLPVLFYLLHTILSSGTLNSSQSSSCPTPLSPYGPSSQFGYATYSTAMIDDLDKRLSSAVLRPLPESFSLGDDFFVDLMPGQLAHTYFTLQRSSYVRFNISLDPKTRLAIYGRQTLPASPTQYDFVQIVHGVKYHTRRYDNARMTRSVRDLKRLAEHLKSSAFVQYLSGGRWHLSILNDDTEIRTIRFSTYLAASEREDCKSNCHNRGLCKEGKCHCYDGFTGPHCEETFCPVVCSGNGIFADGKCNCHHGWKGADCDVAANMCEVPNCNGRGHCNNKGECVCDFGYKGPFCDQRECPHENCSGHGVCHNGKCYCEFGYKGERCDIPYASTSDELCPLSSSDSGHCNGRGHLDTVSCTCNCKDGWTGARCEGKICNMDCGPHGKCVDEKCICDEGFMGDKCHRPNCAFGCEENGKCVNGSCVCNDGWNGENCQLAGCPNNCHNRGECKKIKGNWQCVCPADFGKEDCSIPLEQQCSDGIDNDSDGLTDCEDSECCGVKGSCQNDQYCRTVPDPYQVLIRKPPAPPQASFYQKTAFLLDADSVQQYPGIALFNKSRMSVIRGKVTTSRGGSLMAVRIANSANALFGFTLSRTEGYFDLVVDGGGAVTLQFMRKPFVTHYLTVVVPWNQIIYIGNVVMMMKDESTAGKEIIDEWSQSCLDVFKRHTMKPFAVPSWKMNHNRTDPSFSGVWPNAAAVQESLRIPGTDIFLTYLSSNAVGAKSILSLYLVPESVPKTLRLLRLMIDVEGVHFETTLEAKANLTYVYGWDKVNVYKQRVTGLATAKVSVGYIYANCDRIFWEILNVKLKGHVAPVSDIGSWNLNVHHRYNVLDNVLERGDGGAAYLGEDLSVLVDTVGSKEQRQLTCGVSCNGPVSGASLYMPTAVATSRDGSLFIGDYNLIRMVTNNSVITTVLELSIADTAHRYYLAVHPVTGDLYISLPLRRQIWKIRSLSQSVADLTTNYDVAVGTGELCSVESDCGDGASAELASLTYPKGIAFDTYGNLYIADDRRIRLASASGFMSTIIGTPTMSDYSSSNWQPLSCSTIFPTTSFRPQWPTSLAFDFYSSTLLFLDIDIVFELTAGGNFVNVRAGSPSHCAYLKTSNNQTVRPVFLKSAVAIATSDDGRVLIAESDRRRLHRIRSIDRYGRMALLAGAESSCDCHRPDCLCDNENGLTVNAINAHLHNPSSLAVDQRGNIHIADESNLRIRTLKATMPILDPRTKLYEIPSSDLREIYYFNRLGQHISTKDTSTNKFIYNFTYHSDTSYGKLNHVSGAGGHRIYFIRRSENKVLIENADGQSTAHIVDGMLEKFVLPSGDETDFGYDSHTGLLKSKTDSNKRAWFYEYDARGRLEAAILPTGDVTTLKYGLFRDQLLSETKNMTGFDWESLLSNNKLNS